MNQKLINKIFSIWIILFLILGIIYKNGRLHIWGKGIENEEELTFGLTKLLNLERVTFYEINFFFLCLIASILLFGILKLPKLYKRNDKIFDSLWIVSLITFLIPVAILIWNFQTIEQINPNEKDYKERFFSKLDDSVKTNQIIKTELEIIDFQICFYSLIILTILLLGITIKFIFPKSK